MSASVTRVVHPVWSHCPIPQEVYATLWLHTLICAGPSGSVQPNGLLKPMAYTNATGTYDIGAPRAANGQMRHAGL